MFDNHTPRNTSMQRDFAHDGAHNVPNDGTRQGTHSDGSPPHVDTHNVPEPSMLSLLIIAAVVSLIVASVRQWRNRPRPTENLFKRNGDMIERRAREAKRLREL
jgi:hypothetical protein